MMPSSRSQPWQSSKKSHGFWPARVALLPDRQIPQNVSLFSLGERKQTFGRVKTAEGFLGLEKRARAFKSRARA